MGGLKYRKRETTEAIVGAVAGSLTTPDIYSQIYSQRSSLPGNRPRTEKTSPRKQKLGGDTSRREASKVTCESAETKSASKPWEVDDGLWARIEPLLPVVQRRYRHPEGRRQGASRRNRPLRDLDTNDGQRDRLTRPAALGQAASCLLGCGS